MDRPGHFVLGALAVISVCVSVRFCKFVVRGRHMHTHDPTKVQAWTLREREREGGRERERRGIGDREIENCQCYRALETVMPMNSEADQKLFFFFFC